MARRISDPAPVDSTRGMTPIVKASDVIKIGRKRNRQAASTASNRFIPSWSCFSLANYTIRMAFLQANPTRTIKLICVKTLLSPFSSQTPAMAENRVMGTIKMITRGNHQVHEKNREWENVNHSVAGKNLLIGEFGPFVFHSVRQLFVKHVGDGA